jgi:hypothetical protein
LEAGDVRWTGPIAPLSEFTFRLNDGDVARHTLDRIASLLFAANGKRLTYKALIA